MKIWIDADAAPKDAKEIVFRACTRRQVATVLVANQPLRLPVGHPQVSFELVPGHPDAADRYIVEHAAAGDLVITSDLPLAAALVAQQVIVIDPRGIEMTPDNIGSKVASRNLMDVLREAGDVTGGPAAYGLKHRQNFASTFDRVLTRCLKRK
jgi:uncharacterized protein YaiI (UPF0178 family)